VVGDGVSTSSMTLNSDTAISRSITHQADAAARATARSSEDRREGLQRQEAHQVPRS
jgi:hypothetical protein